MTRLHWIAAWLGAIALVAGVSPAANANPLPWQGDSAQLHGPGQTVFVDHQPSNFGGPASDTLFVEFPGWQRVADDFLLPADAELHRIVWWGFHNMNIQPLANEDFRIRVYDQRPSDSLPGAVLYEQSFTSVPRTWTGQFVLVSGAPQEFRYEVDLPFPLSLPTTSSLWLEIVQIGDENTRFRWENSNFSLPQNGKVFVNSLTANMDWESTFPTGPTNAAFQLIGDVPEPCSFMLFAGTGVAVLRRRSRRWN